MHARAKVPKQAARHRCGGGEGNLHRDVENANRDDNTGGYDSQEKEEARWASVSSVAVYIVGQVLGIWVIITRRNNLTVSFAEGQYSQTLSFTAMVLATNVMYCIVMYSDPGWLHPDRNDDTEDAAIRDYSPTLKDAQWCKYCKRTKLLRAKHCHQCGVCVAKFDHHCYWIYNCVGGLNHCRFWWLLLLILISISWGNSLVWMSFVPAGRHHTHRVNDVKNLLPFMMSGIGLLSWLFVFVVFICHTVLALSNCTTWEFAKRSKIPYLNTLPFEKNPFDRGYWGNVKSFCCTRRTVWTLPASCEPDWV